MNNVVRKTLAGVRTYAPVLAPFPSRLTRFVILCPGRCGSELLVDLLRSQAGVTCDGEVLRQMVRFPTMMMEARARSAGCRGTRFYGCKVLAGQLRDVQGIRDPAKFIGGLEARGWVFIRLTRRNLLRQSISWIRAFERSEFHTRTATGPEMSSPEPISIPPEQLIAMMHVHQQTNEWIQRMTANAKCSLTLVYEDDLESSDRHQATVDAVMDLVGGTSSPVSTDLVPTGTRRLQDGISNMDEIVRLLRQTRFASMLEEEDPSSADTPGSPNPPLFRSGNSLD